MENKVSSEVRLYCCGGAGINIGQQNNFSKGETGFAKLTPVYIDTADSNIREDLKNSPDFYDYGDTDGSGQVRSENAEVISSRIRDVLQKFRPGDFNIVLSSGGGGSGSVIAPGIVHELLSREIPVVVILIGSIESRKYAENTLNTIKSYEGVSHRTNAPVVVAYAEMSPGARNEIDIQVREIILSLCVLFSRQNREMDSRDIYNWSRFNRVTSFQPQMTGLFIGKDLKDATRRTASLGKPGNVISVATIAKDATYERFDFMPEYHITGFVSPDARLSIDEKSPMHFFVMDSFFNDIAVRFGKMLKDLSETQAARVNPTSILDKDDRCTDTGLVL